jgi:hypothetical protein
VHLPPTRQGAQPYARVPALATSIRTAEAMLSSPTRPMTASGSATLSRITAVGEVDGLDRRHQAELMPAMPLRGRSVTGMPCSVSTNTSFPSQRLDGAANRNRTHSRSWGRCRSPHLPSHSDLCRPSETLCRGDHGRPYACYLVLSGYPCLDQHACRPHLAAHSGERSRGQQSCELARMPPLVQSLCRWPARTQPP